MKQFLHVRARPKITTHFLLGPLRQLLVGRPPVCASGLPLAGSAGGSPFVLPPRSAAKSSGTKERALIFGRALTCSLLIGCGGSQFAFDLAPSEQTFRQNDFEATKTLDILWVIDNSLSMETSQDNLRSNFDSFLDQFLSRDFDFQMAVTTTDAYRALFTDPTKSLFKNTNHAGENSGYRIAPHHLPNMKNVMSINLNQGVFGNGDERAFQSLLAALKNPENSGFLRKDSFLSIIILSDEDDFSHDGITSINGQYTNPNLHSVQFYYDELMKLTHSNDDSRNFSMSTISVLDEECRQQLLQGSGDQKIGSRYLEFSKMSGGIQESICGNFADALNKISFQILELLTGFRLERAPDPTSLQVFVDGKAVVQDSENGWTFDKGKNTIVFHGKDIPRRNAVITVKFKPLDHL